MSDIRGEYIDLRMLSYEFVILEVNGTGCEFALDDIYWDGGGAVSIVDSESSVSPVQYHLYENYPNPFNPLTTISYDLPEDGFVNITIYDITGRPVKELIGSIQKSGFKTFKWDATNNMGQPVSAGLYFYTIQTRNFRDTKKMVLLK